MPDIGREGRDDLRRLGGGESVMWVEGEMGFEGRCCGEGGWVDRDCGPPRCPAMTPDLLMWSVLCFLNFLGMSRMPDFHAFPISTSKSYSHLFARRRSRLLKLRKELFARCGLERLSASARMYTALVNGGARSRYEYWFGLTIGSICLFLVFCLRERL